MESYKIDVRHMTEQEKKDVQNAFFMLGYKWRGSEATYKHLDKPFYFAEVGTILYCDAAEYFFNDKDCEDNKVITYKELMTLAYGDNMMNTQKAAFTKSELKDGMFVRLSNGNIYIHTKGNLLSASGWMPVESYKDNLKHSYDDDWSISHVMELKHNSEKLGYGFSKIGDFEYKYIWKRSEQTEQKKQLTELKAAQEQLLLQAKEIADKIDALQQS